MTPTTPGETTPDDLIPQPLDRATALAARHYVDPAMPARDRHLIFDRAWQLVAHVCQLQHAGDHVVADLARHGVRSRR